MNATQAALDLLSEHDPLQHSVDDDERLDGLRAVVRVRTAGPRPVAGTPWRRRALAVAAMATALPVGVLVLAPALTSSGDRGALLGTASASEGGLSCGSGYAAPIPPHRADPRPWPQVLPEGWEPRQVFARSTSVTGWCTTPSLTAAESDDTGLVVRSLQITGPARDIDVDGGGRAVPDRVGRYAAQRLEPGPDSPPDSHVAWVITDDRGEQWYASVDGYSVQDARRALAAASYVDRAVEWDASAAPDLEVLHERTGAPYPLTGTGQDWYLRFADQRVLEATSGREGQTALASTVVGSRLVEVGGRPARVTFERGQPTSVYAELRPGVQLHLEVRGDLEDVLRLLASVQDLPEDDPRLRDLALPETYEQ